MVKSETFACEVLSVTGTSSNSTMMKSEDEKWLKWAIGRYCSNSTMVKSEGVFPPFPRSNSTMVKSEVVVGFFLNEFQFDYGEIRRRVLSFRPLLRFSSVPIRLWWNQKWAPWRPTCPRGWVPIRLWWNQKKCSRPGYLVRKSVSIRLTMVKSEAFSRRQPDS